MSKPDELPQTGNEYWEGEKYSANPVPLHICDTHTKDKWSEHHGYIDNHDGSISCKFCPWGTRLPGYMRFINNHILDLRQL